MSLKVLIHLESRRTPLDELHVFLPLYHRDRRVHVFRHHVASVQQAHRHVLPHARIAIHHLMIRLEAGIRYLRDRHPLVSGLLRRQDRCIRSLQRAFDLPLRKTIIGALTKFAKILIFAFFLAARAWIIINRIIATLRHKCVRVKSTRIN